MPMTALDTLEQTAKRQDAGRQAMVWIAGGVFRVGSDQHYPEEAPAAAIDFIKRQTGGNKPFFCWFNSTRMHFRTHVSEDRRSPPGLTAKTEYADGMIEHDAHVGLFVKVLDDLGIAGNTILLYTTGNGPHMNSWPDGAMAPFRSEKNANWEGAFRVPCAIRWPGKIPAGTISNGIVHPPRQRAASFSVDQLIEKLTKEMDVTQ